MATILVIEDTEDFRRILNTYITRLGYDVIEASNGLEGIKLAKTYLPSLILLDLMMPLAQGDLALGFIRSTPELKHIPVIITSAHPNARALGQQLDANAVLVKPFPFSELKTLIEQYV